MKKIYILIIVLLLCGNSSANTIFIPNPQSTLSQNSFSLLEYSQSLHSPSTTHAPEPSTLALFGGGFLGLLISFIRRTYFIAKRIFDIFFSIIGLILCAPLLLFVALLIKLTSLGPIFYNQIRVGRGGECFTMYKFRTMIVDAEKDTGPIWANANDSRLIPIGKILRRFHLDELPQLLNVLKGQMSLIGPRPERPVFVDQLKKEIPDYKKRLEVRPGITGLAQVWHRYDETTTDVRKKIKYDLLYIKSMCFSSDLKIFLRTFKVILTGEGAR